MGGDCLRPSPDRSTEFEWLFVGEQHDSAAAAFALIRIGLGLGIWLRRLRPLPLFLILPAMARLRPAVTIRLTGCR